MIPRKFKTKLVALDIDGVLLRGGSVIPGASAAVRKLMDHKVPFVFVTNGGGVHESTKANDLTKKLGIPVQESQIIVSHSPFRNLAGLYKNSRVLIIGDQKKCLDVAKAYGFEQAITVHDYHAEDKHVYPLRSPPAGVAASDAVPPVEAVFVFHDPVDWGLEMQVMSDVLSPQYFQQHFAKSRSQANNGADLSRGHIPVYVSNADVVYTTEHPLPRFTQGAFAVAFRHLYESYHAHPLTIDFGGKPFPVQYRMAEQLLGQQIETEAGAEAEAEAGAVYFGVGDNPKSDIRGANAAGPHWRSVLVRTGIFGDQGRDALIANDPVDAADHVVADIGEAVDLILAYEGEGTSGKP
jgi:HAD superfamily hydrolase (TIGR01456 family)